MEHEPFNKRPNQPKAPVRPPLMPCLSQVEPPSGVDFMPSQEQLDLDVQTSIEITAEQDALGDYADQLLQMAKVPPGMIPGQTLKWINAAHTSPTFLSAVVEIDRHKKWFEFRLFLSTGRKIVMRSGFEGEVMGLTDTAGMDGGIALSTLCATVVLMFAQATHELMITH